MENEFFHGRLARASVPSVPSIATEAIESQPLMKRALIKSRGAGADKPLTMTVCEMKEMEPARTPLPLPLSLSL